MKLVEGHGINDMYWGWASENEWNKLVYRKWHSMLQRCYNEEFHKTENGKCYIGCSVCERWLVLSNFVVDVPKLDGYDRERFLNGELHLDKDKKKDENKHYHFNFCIWLLGQENLSLANKGKQRSEETRLKISEAHKGKHHTEETRLKISENSGKPNKGKLGSEHPSSKQIAQYDKRTNELIKIWGGMKEVERELGIAYQSISACCRGKQKSAGGFIWKYVGGD